jgi:SAM-dependent methyltransferase
MCVVDEHYVPESPSLDLTPYIARGDLSGAHHVIHYLWAIACLGEIIKPGDRILDSGCGDGYGACAIADAFPRNKVVGCDYDRGAVQHAQSRYSRPNLLFVCDDLTAGLETTSGGEFAAITSFEVLEHVQHRDLTMQWYVEHLRNEGALLLSTPCAHNYNQVKPEWVHHRIEFSSASLYDLLKRYFGVLVSQDCPNFPGREVFAQLVGTGITYNPRMNPVVCRYPIRVVNPYR